MTEYYDPSQLRQLGDSSDRFRWIRVTARELWHYHRRHKTSLIQCDGTSQPCSRTFMLGDEVIVARGEGGHASRYFCFPHFFQMWDNKKPLELVPIPNQNIVTLK